MFFTFLVVAGPCLAAPDFSHSTITPRNATPTTSSVAVFDLVLRNTGDEGGMPVYFELNWERAGFFIGIDGLDSIEVDYNRGSLMRYLDLPAGAEKRCSLKILTFNEAKGDALSVEMRLADFQHNSEYWDRTSITLESPPYKGGRRIGTLLFTDAGLMVLLWLLCTLVAWLVFTLTTGRRGARGIETMKGAAGLTFLWMMPVGFWFFFGAMAWKDFQILNEWIGTRGTIIGRHMDVSDSSTRNQGTRKTENTTTYSVVLALKFEDKGKTVYGSGYDPDSFLQIGGRKQREKEINEWTVGSTIACWYNPQDPTEVVVKRGFGGAYIFALLPLPFFIVGVNMFRKRFTEKVRYERSGQ